MLRAAETFLTSEICEDEEALLKENRQIEEKDHDDELKLNQTKTRLVMYKG